jgi:hypothetical protein
MVVGWLMGGFAPREKTQGDHDHGHPGNTLVYLIFTGLLPFLPRWKNSCMLIFLRNVTTDRNIQPTFQVCNVMGEQ